MITPPFLATFLASFPSGRVNARDSIVNPTWSSIPVTLHSTVCVLRSRHQSLNMCQFIQFLKRVLDISPSQKLFQIFFGSNKSAVIQNIQGWFSIRADRCLISFSRKGKDSENLNIILTIKSIMACVGGTLMWVSRRLKKRSMRSKRSMIASWLASTSLATYQDHDILSSLHVWRKILKTRRTPTPEKIIFAGENNCENRY